MMEFYVLNGNLETVCIIDAYVSAIWTKRYNEVGDCELYLQASEDMVNYCAVGNYIAKYDDDEMVCRITSIEITTNAEDGDYLTVIGRDAKSFLDQRIVWSNMTCNGNAETYIRRMVNKALINPDVPYPNAAHRKLIKTNGDDLMALGTSAGFTKSMKQNISYKNVGEKVREICKRYGWGYRVRNDAGVLKFELYKGVNRSQSIIFSADFENLIESDFLYDVAEYKNVALVGGKGQGNLRERAQAGAGDGVDRYEIFVDDKDMSEQMTFGDLQAQFAGHYSINIDMTRTDDPWQMLVTDLRIELYNDEQKAWLQNQYPGGTDVTEDGVDYYELPGNVIVAYSKNIHPDDNTEVNITPIMYEQCLESAGYEALAEYVVTESFTAKVEPFNTYKYGTNYRLGDIVTAQNGYGITRSARIIEAIEAEDENGYTVEPTIQFNPSDD